MVTARMIGESLMTLKNSSTWGRGGQHAQREGSERGRPRVRALFWRVRGAFCARARTGAGHVNRVSGVR